jgi:HlyD family secretion protein
VQSAEAMKDYASRATALLESGDTIKVQNPIGPGEVPVRSTTDQIDAFRLQRTLTSHQWWAAADALDAATARAAALERILADLRDQRDNPIALNTQVDASRSSADATAAGQAAATARLAALQAGSTAEQLAVAQARLDQAEAARTLLDVQLSNLSLTSPIDGIVTQRNLEPGEVATPGTAIMNIADLGTLTMHLFIPEDEIGRVEVGRPVQVRVDSFPGEVFEGRVVFISDQPEFTPRNVQTTKERVNMVFAVKVELPNPDLRLKPGMPADAVIEVAP